MNYYFDTEFIETDSSPGAPHPIHLISIGVVSEDGRSLYMEADDVPWWRANEWVLNNVAVHLDQSGDSRVSRSEMKHWLKLFTSHNVEDTEAQFHAYYGAYDWVLMCQLFGGFAQLPAGWLKFFVECAPLIYPNNKARLINAHPEVPHRADSDARALRDAMVYLKGLPTS